MALPVSSSAAPSPPKRSWREAPHRQQRLAGEVEQAAGAERGGQAGPGRVTGGIGDVIDSRSGPLSLRELGGERAPARRRRRAANSSTDAAVSSTSVDSAAHRPSAVGCASTSGARRHRSPYDSRSSARMTGDATPSG